MWRFNKISQGEPERDPHEAEFFNRKDLDPANALVRESIQNSLDAVDDNDNPVEVVFKLNYIDMSDKNNYFDKLTEHLDSSGLLPDDFKINSMRILTVEDFNTVGLDGKYKKGDALNNTSNFYNFWWREGKSEKEGTKAGRWGLGKIVYSVTSNLRTFWGYTYRKDNKALLMGKSILKSHQYNNELYSYYAYYMKENAMPYQGEDVKEFCNDFNLVRNNTPGLSIAIPMPDESIEADKLIKASIRQYFFPIIKDKLIVKIFDEKNNLNKIDSNNLKKIALKQNWEDTPWEDRDVESLMSFVENVATVPECSHYKLEPPISDSDKINQRLYKNKKLFSDNQKQVIEDYKHNKLISLKVPVFINPFNKDMMKGFFNVYLQKDDTLKQSDEFYIRAGINISDIRELRNKSVRGLLYADDDIVSKFLGDAESPSHTDWKERRESFKEKYKKHQKTLRYIKFSMRDILSIIDQPDKEITEDVLKDIFNIKTEVSEGDKDTTEKRLKNIESNPKEFSISKIKEGFYISSKEENITELKNYKCRVAYDIRRGNPFSKYKVSDFDFSRDAINIDFNNIEITNKDKNIIEFNSLEKDFNLKVIGFDRNRDIIIDIKEVK